MKYLMISLLIMLCSNTVSAQNNKGVKKQRQKASVSKTLPAQQVQRADTIRLQSTAANQAMAAAPSFRIQDPVVNLLSLKAAGAPVKVSESGLMGVPRGTYGFASGRIIFYTNSATSSGTVTGSGSVGTGTSPGTIGSFGSGMSINGKSPYEAAGPFGIRILTPADSTIIRQ